MRRVTVVAGRNCLMARLLPTCVLLVHDVAVGACNRIIAHVRVAFGINECEHSNSHSGSDRESDEGKFEYL